MAQYYNFVTNASGTFTLEEVQRICSVEGQHVQLVENINNGGNGSQQFLAYTPAQQNSEQAIFCQQTINLGSQISATQLDQGQNVFIIKTNETPPPPPPPSILKPNTVKVHTAAENIVDVVDNRVTKPLVECSNDNQQIQWVKMQENSINVDAVSKQNTLLSEKSQTAILNKGQTQNNIAISGYSPETSEKKPIKFYQNKNRLPTNNIQTVSPSIPSDGLNATDRVQRYYVSNIKVTSPSFHNKAVNAIGQNVTTTFTRQVRASFVQVSPTRPPVPNQMSKNPLRLQRPEMEHLSQRIKQAKLRHLQNDQRSQQNIRKNQVSNMPQKTVQNATANSLQTQQVTTNVMQQKQLQNISTQFQQLQKQSSVATVEQKNLHQIQSSPLSPLSPQQNVQTNSDVDADCILQEKCIVKQQSSPSQTDSESSASESIAYLQKVINNPSTTIVQRQIQGNTAKMLVMLPNGEQRLITFDISNNDCTVQDLLEQANITFGGETTVCLVSDSTFGINYIVETVAPSNGAILNEIHEHDSNTSQDSTTMGSRNTSRTISSPDENSNPICQNETFYKKNNERNSSAKLEKLERDGSAYKRGRGRGRVYASRAKIVNKEPECLTISSDEDEEGKTRKVDGVFSNAVSSNASNNLSEEMETILDKEPVITNNSVSSTNIEFSSSNEECTEGGSLKSEDLNFANSSTQNLHTAILCRTVRIGSYKYVPPEKVLITSSGIRFGIPLLEDDTSFVTLDVKIRDLVKVLVHFGKSMPVIFFYTSTSTGAMIRELLGMQDPKGPYYDPAGKDHTHRRITLLPDKITDESKLVLKNVFMVRKGLFEELNPKEANDILVRASPKDNTLTSGLARRYSQTSVSNVSSASSGIQKITVYPPPPAKGGIAINTEDYLCLGEDQFLNDVIIDFYLKYLTLEVLSESDQHRTHVFSSYFYKRLTSPHAQAGENAVVLSAAAKRHARVQKWTKNVNIFEKDFIVIPINEHAHWFLAIICFPGLVGKVTINNKIPKEEDVHKTIQKSKKLKDLKIQAVTIGTTTITPVTTTITIDQGDDGSERDEAEGDDEEMEVDSDDDEETEGQESNKTQETDNGFQNIDSVKVPCILIFDSLAGASRCRVVATLRDYLSCEYVAKMGIEKTFSKDTIKGASPKVPQQSNFTDCGLYVLQYVESFFKDPIKNYTLPIKTLKNWFEEIVVTRKREEISKLLIKLMNVTRGSKNIALPVVNFPTQDGKLKPKPENHLEIKPIKPELDIKKKTMSETETNSRAVNSTVPGQTESPESSTNEVVSKTTYQIIPFSPCTSSTSSTDNSTEMLIDTKIHAARSPNEIISYLKSKRIPRLMVRTDAQDNSQAAKKHKGESF
ncbi:PREDICTED: uncharacterized protein LOC106793974 isoform X2 [Polistes canadensis]|uniref:uncharacterized protein LOC106793974 isoform X2 n=1 Tax=Polistes canadensis TaxID=91411 RepID=UPI000718E9D7|nr:PREDICTED: uncharacterized protein LOC106793974 isoform X2 [Polistes canadensis]